MKQKKPKEQTEQVKGKAPEESLLAGLDIFSEEYDDETGEGYIAPPPVPSVCKQPAAKSVKTPGKAAVKPGKTAAKPGKAAGNPAETPTQGGNTQTSAVQGLISEGTVLETMEEGLADLMSLDYVPEPDEIVEQRREFEGSMYREPKQNENAMRIDILRREDFGIAPAKALAAKPEGIFRGGSRKGTTAGTGNDFAANMRDRKASKKKPENDSRFTVRNPESKLMRGEEGRERGFRPEKKRPESGVVTAERSGRTAGMEGETERQRRMSARDGDFASNIVSPGLGERKPEQGRGFGNEALQLKPRERNDMRDRRPAADGASSDAPAKMTVRDEGFRGDDSMQKRQEQRPYESSKPELRSDRTETKRCFTADVTGTEKSAAKNPVGQTRRRRPESLRFKERPKRGKVGIGSGTEQSLACDRSKPNRRREDSRLFAPERREFGAGFNSEAQRRERGARFNRETPKPGFETGFNRGETKSEFGAGFNREEPGKRFGAGLSRGSAMAEFEAGRQGRDAFSGGSATAFGRTDSFDRRDTADRRDFMERKEKSEKTDSRFFMDSGSAFAERDARRDADRMSMDERERKKRWEL